MQEPTNQISRRPVRTFSSARHVTMGLMYVLVGGCIIYVRMMGTMVLPASVAWGFGGLLVLYGIFRIYRGLRGGD